VGVWGFVGSGFVGCIGCVVFVVGGGVVSLLGWGWGSNWCGGWWGFLGGLGVPSLVPRQEHGPSKCSTGREGKRQEKKG